MLPDSMSATSKRSGKRMASHYKRGNKIWITYFVDKVRHRKSTGLDYNAKNIKIVENEIIPQLMKKIATGEIYKKKPKSFEYYGGIFLKQKSMNRSYFTAVGYYRRVIEHFKGRNIDTITRLDIKEYLISLNIKNISRNKYKSCVKEIFELAVDDGVIPTNPAINIKFPQDRKTKIEYYTREEVEKLLIVAKGVMKTYLEIAFNTGMRTGEILGLQLSDFKDDGYIHLKRTRTLGVVGEGKNYNAKRNVPYNAYMYELAKSIQPKDNLYLFGNIDDARKLRFMWRDVCIDAGVKKHKLYSTRHTFATLMLQESIVSINELSGLLGHSSPKVTLAHYASVIESKNIDLGSNFALFRHNIDTVQNKEALK